MKPMLLLGCFSLGCLMMATYSFRANRMSAAESKEGTTVVAIDNVVSAPFGTTQQGDAVTLFTCTNRNGLVLKVMDYGATIVSLETPDRNGALGNIVLTCPDLKGFEACTMYFNSAIGRYCNRIAKGKFSLNGKEYTLATNNEPNHLHGGTRGFDKRMWKAEPIDNADEVGVLFSYQSADGEEGYPGNLTVQVRYVLNQNNELVMEYMAETDQATPINLTNHNYWNLAGQGTILDHNLRLDCDQFLPVDANSIPTGELSAVSATPFDFTTARRIGAHIGELSNEPQGYDHCLVIRGEAGRLRPAAWVMDPKSGRTMEIFTTEPGVQFYSGNYLDGAVESGGYAQYSGFCLETQHFPDSPNRPEFPSTILKPGDRYFHKTVHRFGVAYP